MTKSDGPEGYRMNFLQAEDGMRYIGVTGVQTCALPIWRRVSRAPTLRRSPEPGEQPGADPDVPGRRDPRDVHRLPVRAGDLVQPDQRPDRRPGHLRRDRKSVV